MDRVCRKQIQMKAETLHRKTQFERKEIEILLFWFWELTKHAGKSGLDRSTFRDILQYHFKMTDDIIMDRVFRVFDQDNDSRVNADEWVKGLSTFLRGPLEERIKFCFDVYDMNGDNFISRDDMFQFLKTCLVKQTIDEDVEEGVKDLIDIMVRKMDKDHDGRVSYDEFYTAVMDDISGALLLEALGPCLPDEKTAKDIMEEVTDAYHCGSIEQSLTSMWAKY